MSQPILNKAFYFNNNKDRKRYKYFQNIFDKKINFTLRFQARRKYKKPFKPILWSDSETLDGKELKFKP